MLAYIQISKTITKKKNELTFQKLYRNCFPHIHHSTVAPAILNDQYQAGHIVGAVLLIGYVEQDRYERLIDAANQQHLKFYISTLSKKRTIHCYPVVAVLPFDESVKSTQKGQISALKIKDDLLKKLKSKVPVQVLQCLSNDFMVTNKKILTHRILTLRKEHAINLMAGIKTAEFRTNKLGDRMLAKIKAHKDRKSVV